ncbi:hypothetical protein QCE63_28635 [Caballeronia sp. LZ065]|nr:hypothetical protein [Caballeronia sp. LZ065]
MSVFIGLCVLASSWPFLQLDVEFYLRTTVAVGDVTRLNHGAYHPEVALTTSSGERISFPGSSTYPVEVGDRLEVRYIRSAPRTGPKVNQTFNLFGFMPVLVDLGIVIAGLRGKLVFFGSNDNELPKK